MFRRKGFALIAACAALTCGGLVRADVNPTTLVSTNTVFQPVLMDDMATTTTAPAATAPAAAPAGGSLMAGLRTIKVGDTLDNLGIVITGYVEGSWTYNAHPIPGNIMSDRVFDTKAESVIFDGADLQANKSVDYTSSSWTWGFTAEALYGWDAAYTHSNGLGFYSNGKIGAAGTANIHPKAQIDLIQANFSFTLPVWHGIGFQGGKWDTLLGYEVIDANANPFYSHSFIFAEEPFTHTGALLSAYLTDPASADQIKLTGGITRGWDQATEDNNGSIDYTGQLSYSKVDTANNNAALWSLYLNGITGDEQPSGPQDGWRSVLDVVGHYTVSDQVNVGINGMYGWQAQADQGGFGGGNGQWYGAALYGQYAPTSLPMFVFNIRAEWFDDQDGAAPTQLSAGTTNIPNQFYEGTVGVTVKPFVNGLPACCNTTQFDGILSGLAIRPEFRWDYSDKAAFNGGTQHDQFTAAVEAYFSF